MSEKQTTRITVFSGAKHDEEWVPDKLVEAIAWFNSKLDQIPLEFQNIAEIDIDAERCYDSSYGHIEIAYIRPETDEEAKVRLKNEEQRMATFKARELAELNRLKAKYS